MNESLITFRVSEKKAVSVYGLGRFPVTLYRTQWERLIAHLPELERFIKENRGDLAAGKGVMTTVSTASPAATV